MYDVLYTGKIMNKAYLYRSTLEPQWEMLDRFCRQEIDV